MSAIEQVHVKVKETGIVYTGWTDVEISKSMDDASTSFSMNTGDIPDVVLKAGDLVQIYYDKKLVTTGYIDTVREEYSATSHDIQITGRSRTKDLVDCSASPQQWTNAKISNILDTLCKPFGIKAYLEIDDVIIPTFAITKDSSETVMSAIHRLADMMQATVTDNSAGDLVLTRASDTRSELTILNIANDKRSNVLRGSYSDDEQQRYSIVSMRSQAIGNDESFGRDIQNIQASATDEKNISRYRPLIIDASEPLNTSEALAKVNWQIAYNSGKSREFQYTVPGWGNDKTLWKLNTLVDIEDHQLIIKATLLLIQIRFSKSSRGTVTDLVLYSKDAYTPDPTIAALPDKKAKKRKKTKPDASTISYEDYAKSQGK